MPWRELFGLGFGCRRVGKSFDFIERKEEHEIPYGFLFHCVLLKWQDLRTGAHNPGTSASGDTGMSGNAEEVLKKQKLKKKTHSKISFSFCIPSSLSAPFCFSNFTMHFGSGWFSSPPLPFIFFPTLSLFIISFRFCFLTN